VYAGTTVGTDRRRRVSDGHAVQPHQSRSIPTQGRTARCQRRRGHVLDIVCSAGLHQRRTESSEPHYVPQWRRHHMLGP